MVDPLLDSLRSQIDTINYSLLDLLNKRAAIALEIGKRKAELGIAGYDPVRESTMLADLLTKNQGPFTDDTLTALFKSVFQATLELQKESNRESYLVSRRSPGENTVVEVNGVAIGKDPCVVAAGPCSVENRQQMETIAEHLSKNGVKILRGGAFKPRTSPYNFQGLGLEGLKLLKETADKFGMAVVTEVVDTRDVEQVAKYADILQIGARNMFNYALLKEVGQIDVPVLLKRNFGATLQELMLSAEYILSQGNRKVILCERGIRTFEPWTRNTLDISAVPLLKSETHLPVMVDISHAAGRRDILVALAKASVAAGCDAIMIEVHNNPALAFSDNSQQLDLPSFDNLLKSLR